MKELLQNTRLHFQTVFTIKKTVLLFILITGTCFINYFTPYHLWPSGLRSPVSFLWLTTLFTFFFVSGYLLVYKEQQNENLNYVWLLILAPVLFSAKITLPFHVFFPSSVTKEMQAAFYQPIYWIGGVVFISIVIMLLHRLYEKRVGFYYTGKMSKRKSYFFLFAFMIPLLVFASARDNFQQVYPKAKILTYYLNDAVSWQHYLFFEFAYIFDFITIELFFRGLLIATMSRLLGIHSILPVALFYFSIHLGKPMQEAVSSFFGGFILGSISYQTKSIWGGCLVHIGIALSMELLSILF